MAVATFGAGCFWGVEYFFNEIAGVTQTTCGYMGGDNAASTYKKVKTGQTGHAEVVQVEYDESLVCYQDLLEIFWSNHNPTTPNRQGDDVGSQYRSVIFFHNDQQKISAEQSRQALISSGKWGERQIVTQITPALEFNRAEEYHQNYLKKNNLPSCHISF